MTKDKTNDFIKIKNVKEYIKSKGGLCRVEILQRLKTIVKEEIDKIYPDKKTESINEENKNVQV